MQVQLLAFGEVVSYIQIHENVISYMRASAYLNAMSV